MKYYTYAVFIIIGALNITSCGTTESVAPAPQVTPAPTITPTPTPSASPSPVANINDALVGNWIDTSGNTLDFKNDGTAMSDQQPLLWSVDSSNNINFLSGAISVDSCSFEILSSGGLTSALVVTLDLGCNKAGELTYTKAP